MALDSVEPAEAREPSLAAMDAVRSGLVARGEARAHEALTAIASPIAVVTHSRSMSLRNGDEHWIRATLAQVLQARRDLMMESLDRLVRQCDAKLPRIAPSLFEAPVTEARWLAFLRAEEVKAQWHGDEFERLAATVRLATRHPRCKTLEEIVERWLPDEDALREVVIATRPAVHAWWSAPSSTFASATIYALYGTLEPHEQLHCTVTRLVASVRDELGEEFCRECEAELTRTRDPAAVRALAARARAELVAREVASGLLSGFDAIAQGYSGIVFHEYYNYEVRMGTRDSQRSAAIRAHYPTLDLELLWRVRSTMD